MLKYILHIGIGGPHHGPKAVYDALHQEGQPVMLFASTVSTHQRAEIERELAAVQRPEEILLICGCESGKTLESINNLEYFYETLTKQLGSIDHRVIIITNEGSELWEKAGTHQWQRHAAPHDPRNKGRFSVFTPVGLVPLQYAGIDVQQFQKGSADARERFTEQKARDWFARYERGLDIQNFFFFNPELESLGGWCRQLIAESLGKDAKGILPIVSIGTNDLHSTLQLYMGGPRNIYTTFVSAKPLPGIVEAILEGVKVSYQNQNLPFEHLEFPELNAYHLGFFMQTLMLEVVALAKLMGVDPYTQPAVEEYKAIARSRV